MDRFPIGAVYIDLVDFYCVRVFGRLAGATILCTLSDYEIAGRAFTP